MAFNRYVSALRRWAWLLIACPVAAALVAGAVSYSLPKVYQGRVSILIKLSPSNTGSNLLTSDQIALTYADLVTSRPVLSKVVSDLQLDATVEELAPHVSVNITPNTTILVVTVSDINSRRAAAIANTLANDFIAQTRAVQQRQFANSSAGIQTQIDTVQRQISHDQNAANQLNAIKPLSLDQQSQLADLNQAILANRTHYNDLINALANLESQNAQSTDNLVVVAPASPQTVAASPNTKLNIALAAIIGLLLGVALALVLEQFDQSVRDEGDLAARTGLVILGRVPVTPARAGRLGELVTLGAGPGSLEAYEVLRTNLVFATLDRDIRVIAVTSSLPGEGSSRTAANLAAVLAQAGHRTLLVDADLRRPSQHRIFGGEAAPGLANLVSDEVREDEAIIPVAEIPGLWLLAAGTSAGNPSQVLGAARTGALLRHLRQGFRYVILDTPPVNAVADSLVIAPHVDAHLLVVGAGATTVPALERARTALAQAGANLLGGVLNRARTPAGAYGSYSAARGPVPANGPRR